MNNEFSLLEKNKKHNKNIFLKKILYIYYFVLYYILILNLYIIILFIN